MKFFEKKPEKSTRTDVIDSAYIDKLLSGGRTPAKPVPKPASGYPKYLIWCGFAALVLAFLLITLLIAISVGRRTDPDFGFRDLFVPTTASPTQQTTTLPSSTAGTTEPPTQPPAEPSTVPPTEPPTEPPTAPPTEPPTQPTTQSYEWIMDMDDIPDVTECVNYPSQYLLEGGYSGLVQFGNNGDTFTIELPLLEPFSEGARSINAEIKSIFQPTVDEVRHAFENQANSVHWKVGYETHLNGDVLSIVISQQLVWDSTYYYVFNLDVSTGQQLDKFEMIERYTGMSYPEFLMRANYSLVYYLREQHSTASDAVSTWLSGIERDISVMMGHQLALDGAGKLILLNDCTRDMVGFQMPLQVPFNPNAHGAEYSDWEKGSYCWIFTLYTDEDDTAAKGNLLAECFLLDPESFLRYLSEVNDEWTQDTAVLLAAELPAGKIEQFRTLCSQYLNRSDTAKAAQALLDALESRS